MRRHDPSNWMFSDAVEMLNRVERLHRQMFQPARSPRPTWEPPVDVIETEDQVLVLAALPGVDPDKVETAIEGAALRIFGERTLPVELDGAVIHRMELPQGCFERRIPLPAGRYDGVRRTAAMGCIIVSLHKTQ